MKTVTSVSYQDQVVVIDDIKFVDCSFVDCILSHEGHPLIFERIQLTNCRYMSYGIEKPFDDFLKLTGVLTEGDLKALPDRGRIH